MSARYHRPLQQNQSTVHAVNMYSTCIQCYIMESDLTEALAAERRATRVRTVVAARERHEAALQSSVTYDVDADDQQQDDDDDGEQRDDARDLRLRHATVRLAWTRCEFG